MIILTDNAAKELKSLIQKQESKDDTGLRLSVSKGGCAGMQYVMQVQQAQDGDQLIEKDGARVYLSPDSLEYLNGCEVYYEYGLTDSGFKIRNPNASRSCGCGTSFEAAGEEGTYDPANECK
ncbi:MAG: iron-sulfur cluster assembly accessory protein [Rubritalea sp.]|jgi:iron-sulfur cluster assembly accessory protein|tara:strand:+ start:1267 stop:1632 length:366 start_codon:yes stop_codon:yes gene_type:complete